MWRSPEVAHNMAVLFFKANKEEKEFLGRIGYDQKTSYFNLLNLIGVNLYLITYVRILILIIG